MTLPTNFDEAVEYYAPRLVAAGVPKQFLQLMAGEIEDLRIRVGVIEQLQPKPKSLLSPVPPELAQKMGVRVVEELKNTNDILTAGAKYPYSEVSSEPDGLEDES